MNSVTTFMAFAVAIFAAVTLLLVVLSHMDTRRLDDE